MFLITMVNYKRLINKYYKREGKNLTAQPKIYKGERNRNEYHKKMRLEANRKNRYLILQELLKEAPFHITQTQHAQIVHWINSFNKNFKNFHRRSSEETIILAFIMIQYKQANPNIEVSKYTICKKYKLTQPVFSTIQNRLIFELMRTTPMIYSQSKHYNQYLDENEEDD